MDHKRGDLTNFSSKAQITIFMILGLIILVVFLFLLQLSTRLNQEKLDISREKVFDAAFKKEGLRLYVDDCLQDELEKGLLLLGRQGRLWADQPGGRLHFEPERSGIVYAPGELLGEFDSSRIAYGVTKKDYIEQENAYPCLDEGHSPEFCQYKFPNTTLGFGTLELLPSTLRSDLQRFMANRTVWCVQQFIANNISRQAVLESEPAEVSIDILDEGINIKSEYPLRFAIGRNEFFHLSTFDFFYSSRFGTMLNDIVTFPLQQDQRYLDFDYSAPSLEEQSFTFASEVDLGRNCRPVEDHFICQRSLRQESRSSLGIEMTQEQLPNGDDVFSFKPALYSIVNSPEPFVFRVARQNRPPALDYIERGSCPIGGYDYLVIKNDPVLGGINVSVFALDPDEDAIQYQFIAPPRIPLTPEDNVTEEYVRDNLDVGPYYVTINASDEHGLSDWQDVRILVDRAMDASVSFKSPYEDISYDNGPASYRLSKEDPVYLQFHVPRPSIDPTAQPVPTEFNYNDGTGEKDFNFVPPEGLPEGDSCYTIPKSIAADGGAGPFSCDGLDDYVETDIGFSPEKYPQHPFRETTYNGRLLLSYAADYCGTERLKTSTTLNIRVDACAPHQNSTHPWGYNEEGHYEKYKYDTTTTPEGKIITDKEKYVGTEDINPFETTHACCLSDWTIAQPADNKECFINPAPDCYDQIRGLTTKEENKGYVLEKEIQSCKGDSGIRCEGDYNNELYLQDNKMMCGSENADLCTKPSPQCAGKPAFSITPGGWCAGTMGCKLEKKAIVYTGNLRPALITPDRINRQATELAQRGITPGGNSEFPFHSECKSADLGRPCDGDFDGKFNEHCQNNGVCS
ncbi:hypothetical protein HYU22_04890 [Candidatus Woesearchaeota archaeon]|nr:hypothetical protein [Candidatus Woesearchaeota archaeon]